MADRPEPPMNDMVDTFRPFSRSVKASLLNKLRKQDLFRSKLYPDICDQQGQSKCRSVFMAVRNNSLDFYHRGGRLFTYDGKGFSTHLKYCSVFKNPNKKGTDVREHELPELKRIDSFVSEYKRVKELCGLYSGQEAAGVSKLYSRFPYTAGNTKTIMVLDIEASFDSRAREDSGDTQDRIDLVLYCPNRKALLFVEAKTIANPDVKTTQGCAPAVCSQITRYRQQVRVQKKHILKAYRKTIEAIECILDLSIEQPMEVIENVPLLLFGFNGAQKKENVKPIEQAMKDNGVTCLSIGDPSSVKPETLESWFKKVT